MIVPPTLPYVKVYMVGMAAFTHYGKPALLKGGLAAYRSTQPLAGLLTVRVATGCIRSPPLLWIDLCQIYHHRWPYLGHLTVEYGPCMARTLVIDLGPHTQISSSMPAGMEQCGVTRAPGALVTDDAVCGFGRG